MTPDYKAWAEAGRQRAQRYENFAKHNDLRPSEAIMCLRTVAGKRCLNRGWGSDCVCQKYRGAGGLADHARVWLTPGGQHWLTWEPYGATGSELASLLADCDELGLRVHVSASSPHNPGSTLFITITPARLP